MPRFVNLDMIEKSGQGYDSLLKELGTEKDVSADIGLTLTGVFKDAITDSKARLRVYGRPFGIISINGGFVPARDNADTVPRDDKALLARRHERTANHATETIQVFDHARTHHFRASVHIAVSKRSKERGILRRVENHNAIIRVESRIGRRSKQSRKSGLVRGSGFGIVRKRLDGGQVGVSKRFGKDVLYSLERNLVCNGPSGIGKVQVIRSGCLVVGKGVNLGDILLKVHYGTLQLLAVAPRIVRKRRCILHRRARQVGENRNRNARKLFGGASGERPRKEANARYVFLDTRNRLIGGDGELDFREFHFSFSFWLVGFAPFATPFEEVFTMKFFPFFGIGLHGC